jgi:hypothetical protein
MTVVGFVDQNNERITFERLRKGEGDFGPVPRAVVRALSRQYRAADHYGDPELFGGLPAISMTTLINPVRIARLKERHETFVDPLANVWAAFGTIAHGMFEADAEAGDMVERKMAVKRGGIWITGTFDLLESQQEERHYAGKDYKVTSAYSVKSMLGGQVKWDGDKADYFWQGNGYKWLAEQPDAFEIIEEPDPGEALHGRIKMVKKMIPWEPVSIDSWDLVSICRDWSKRKDGKDLPTPFNVVPVDLIAENHRIENYLNQRTTMYLATDMVEDNDLPECTDKEVWGYLPGGQGRRCSQWCEVANVCNQNLSNMGL